MIALAVLAVIGIFFYAEISEAFSQIRDDTAEARDQAKVDIQDGVCDLHITFFAEVDNVLFSVPTELFYTMGIGTDHPEVASWFFDCSAPSLAFLPALDFNLLRENSFFVIGGEEHTMRLKVKAPNGDFRACERYPNLCKTIVIADGLVFTPHAVQKTFLIENIPFQDYIIEVSIEEFKLNGRSSGSPITYNVVT